MDDLAPIIIFLIIFLVLWTCHILYLGLGMVLFSYRYMLAGHEGQLL